MGDLHGSGVEGEQACPAEGFQDLLGNLNGSEHGLEEPVARYPTTDRAALVVHLHQAQKDLLGNLLLG